MSEFTGERLIPGLVEPDLWNEHIARYRFAYPYAAARCVLDAGCGTGYGSDYLGQTARAVTAVDISAEALAYARSHYARPNLEFFQASCSSLPFPPESFELIVSFEVLEHLQDWQACLEEFRRVLAPKGIALISTPNRDFYAESRRDSGPNPFHVHEFDPREFSEALHEFFPYVQLLTQNHTGGILVQPAGPANRTSATVENPFTDLESANYLLGFCSFDPAPAPGAFVFIPSAANVLRERECHIAMLAADLESLRHEKQNLVEMFRSQTRQLIESNHWAASLDTALTEARARVVALQAELAAAQQSAVEQIARLEHEKADISAGYEGRLRELDAELRGQLAECIRRLDAAEATVIERTQWAHGLQAENEMMKSSRWLKLGKTIGVGPLPRER